MTNRTHFRYNRWCYLTALVVAAGSVCTLLFGSGSETVTVQTFSRGAASGKSPAEVLPPALPATTATPTPPLPLTGQAATQESVGPEQAPAPTPSSLPAARPSPPPRTNVTTGPTETVPAAAAEESPHPVAEPAPGEETSPGRYKENPDAGNFIALPRHEGPEGLASSHVSRPERTRFSVYVGGNEAGGSVRAHLTNVSGREMRFAEGLRVVAEVTRDGEAWRQFVLADPAITALGPGQEASLQTEFLFEGPGQYSSWGSVEIELV